jgi:hypothetical protein
MNCLRALEPWDRGFESHSRHGCLCAFVPCLCCPVQVEALRRADPTSKQSYRLYIGLGNWKTGQGPKGCRATGIYIYIYISSISVNNNQEIFFHQSYFCITCYFISFVITINHNALEFTAVTVSLQNDLCKPQISLLCNIISSVPQKHRSWCTLCFWHIELFAWIYFIALIS